MAIALACISTAAALLASCEVHPPAVKAVNARLYVEPAGVGDAKLEKLSIFASIGDEDGAGDIQYLYVVHDESELAWQLEADTWMRKDEGEAVWLGSNGLSRPDGSPLPRGAYRLVAVDMAGERAEYQFGISAPPTDQYALPIITLDSGGGAITVSSQFLVLTAFFSDAGGNVVKTANAAAGRNSLDGLWGNSEWRAMSDYLCVYGLDPRSEAGFFSRKVRLPD